MTGGGVRFGHRVLETTEGSPSFKAGLVPYFDFVVAINDIQLVRWRYCPRGTTAAGVGEGVCGVRWFFSTSLGVTALPPRACLYARKRGGMPPLLAC